MPLKSGNVWPKKNWKVWLEKIRRTDLENWKRLNQVRRTRSKNGKVWFYTWNIWNKIGKVRFKNITGLTQRKKVLLTHMYFIEPVTQWFCTHKSFAWNVRKSKYFRMFHMIFPLLNIIKFSIYNPHYIIKLIASSIFKIIFVDSSLLFIFNYR